MTGRRAAVGEAILALLALLAIVVGVPVFLLVTVGNPWPGRVAVELGDEARIVIGVLATLAWILWLRFVVAVVVELAHQLEARRRASTPSVVAPAGAPAPPPAGGIVLLAHRLVATVLILLPALHSTSVAAPMPLAAPSAVVAGPPEAEVVPPRTVGTPPPAPPPAPAPATDVVVTPGDTLIGLARSHLGDAARWREIFELNRDRPQADGGRVSSPSTLRVGWALRLPPDSRYVEPDVVTIEAGDNLWSLAEERLERAGVHDPASTLRYVDEVIAANPEVVEDPDLIYPGERFEFPAIGTPPRPPPRPSPPQVVEPELPPPFRPREPVPTVPPTTTVAPTTTSTTAPPAALIDRATPAAAPAPSSSPSPLGLGEVALLSTGVLGLLAAHRRARLRAARPRARVPEPTRESIATERLLRSVDAGERLLRVDVAVRAAAHSLVDGPAQIAVVLAGTDGEVELVLTAPGHLPPPWTGAERRWVLAGTTPIELLADAARSVGVPCLALVPVGVSLDERDVLVDLEAVGVLAVAGDRDAADTVVRGVASALATSLFAESVNVIAVDVDPCALLGHPRTSYESTVDDALELAATFVGTTASARHTTFALRARHTGGEAWEPTVVLVGSGVGTIGDEAVAAIAAHRRQGIALVVGSDVPGARWSIRAGADHWTVEPLGLPIAPVGLRRGEVEALNGTLRHADEPLVDDEVVMFDEERADPAWSLMVRVLGPVDVVDQRGTAAAFDRAKAQELVVWLALHRERSTRSGARTALWELDVRDATFANVVSDARRAMARLVEPEPGQEWLGRTLSDALPLHDGVVCDADLLRARLDHARLQPPELAIETLRPAVELIRGLPFSGTGYLWPDAEGTTSNLVLLATSAATELAGHHLSMGDVDGVFWATGQGLAVLPGHEELIGLRMRAHARAGDLAGVRLEWESYERVLHADPWSDGAPAEKLAVLRRELLS